MWEKVYPIQLFYSTKSLQRIVYFYFFKIEQDENFRTHPIA